MSRQILKSKIIGVKSGGDYYKSAFMGMPGIGGNSSLLSASAHFCQEEWESICRELGLGEVSPAAAANSFTEEEALAIAWAISPKPLKCTPDEAVAYRLLESPEAAYLQGNKSDKAPDGNDVENAKVFQELLGRMPNSVIATKGFRKGVAVSVNGRTYENKSGTTAADPTKVLAFRLRGKSNAEIKDIVTAAGITIPKNATDADILALAKTNAAIILA